MIKYKTASKYRQFKPRLYKIGGKWDYEPAFGHELQAYANNYMAHEHCHRVNKWERLANSKRRAKHISTLDTASNSNSNSNIATEAHYFS